MPLNLSYNFVRYSDEQTCFRIILTYSDNHPNMLISQESYMYIIYKLWLINILINYIVYILYRYIYIYMCWFFLGKFQFSCMGCTSYSQDANEVGWLTNHPSVVDQEAERLTMKSPKDYHMFFYLSGYCLGVNPPFLGQTHIWGVSIYTHVYSSLKLVSFFDSFHAFWK